MGSIETGQDPTTDSSTNDSPADLLADSPADSVTSISMTGPAGRGEIDGPAGRDETTTDDQLLALYATALADGVEEALPGWVAAAVVRRLTGDLPDGLPENFEDRVIAAGREAAIDVGGRVRELLALDVDEQWTNPLTLIRTAIRYPNELLREIGVATVSRDEQAQRFYPDDVFDLIPASFAELGPAVHDLGLSWGAAKAHVHLRRRREEEVA